MLSYFFKNYITINDYKYFIKWLGYLRKLLKWDSPQNCLTHSWLWSQVSTCDISCVVHIAPSLWATRWYTDTGPHSDRRPPYPDTHPYWSADCSDLGAGGRRCSSSVWPWHWLGKGCSHVPRKKIKVLKVLKLFHPTSN